MCTIRLIVMPMLFTVRVIHMLITYVCIKHVFLCLLVSNAIAISNDVGNIDKKITLEVMENIICMMLLRFTTFKQ
jgi:hypothetical protein